MRTSRLPNRNHPGDPVLELRDGVRRPYTKTKNPARGSVIRGLPPHKRVRAGGCRVFSGSVHSAAEENNCEPKLPRSTGPGSCSSAPLCGSPCEPSCTFRKSCEEMWGRREIGQPLSARGSKPRAKERHTSPEGGLGTEGARRGRNATSLRHRRPVSACTPSRNHPTQTQPDPLLTQVSVSGRR